MDFLLDLYKSFDRTYTYRIAGYFWEFLVDLYPYLLAGIVIIGLMQSRIDRISRLSALKKATTLNILIATLLGMAAPLSVYVAVPMAASLIAAGVPAALMVAFMFACPLIDPNLLLLTYGALGWQIALARVVAALILGFGAGIIYREVGEKWLPLNPPEDLSLGACRHSKHGLRKRPFLYATWRQGLFIIKIFTISLLLAAAIKAFITPQMVNTYLGSSGNVNILAAIALGIPFYQCGGASIPIMQSLKELGLSSGAVVAFFISGPATKIPAMYAFREGYGWRFLIAFLGYTLTGAFVAGVILNLFS